MSVRDLIMRSVRRHLHALIGVDGTRDRKKSRKKDRATFVRSVEVNAPLDWFAVLHLGSCFGCYQCVLYFLLEYAQDFEDELRDKFELVLVFGSCLWEPVEMIWVLTTLRCFSFAIRLICNGLQHWETPAELLRLFQKSSKSRLCDSFIHNLQATFITSYQAVQELSALCYPFRCCDLSLVFPIRKQDASREN